MKALIIVDVQRDFSVPGGSLYVKDGEKIVPGINELIENGDFDCIVATQDWHPAGHGSFASNHPGKNPFEMGELNGKPQMLWPNHCVQDTPGAEFHPDLKVPEWAYIVRKGLDRKVDSYSAFYDNDKRASTGLTEYLKSVDVDEVEICGLAFNFCVMFTALDAIGEGFQVSVIEKLCRSVEMNPGDHEKAKQEMVERGIKII